jgi:Response regulator containing CheY-like receiver domain and AraC-type DNA-binding domain
MARILIVDDSPTETFRFKEILGKHGFEVIEASNGADGVTMAQAELPDLVLMDVVMPGVNGSKQHVKLHVVRPPNISRLSL